MIGRAFDFVDHCVNFVQHERKRTTVSAKERVKSRPKWERDLKMENGGMYFFVSGSERDFLSLNLAYASVKLLLLPQQFDQCPVRVRHFLVNS